MHLQFSENTISPPKYFFFKSEPKFIKLLLNYLLNSHHKTTFGIFEILKIEILAIFFSFSLTWDPMGVKISKCYPSYISQPKAFKPVLNFPPNGPYKITLGSFEILSVRFLMIVFQKFHIHLCTLWRNQKPQLSGKRAIVEQNGMKFGTRGQ